MARKVEFDVLALAKAEGFDKAAADVDKLSASSKKTNQDMKLLSTGLLSLAPAAIPIAAAGTALLGLGVAGGVAALAVKGIEKEMKAGTPTGLQFTALVGTLKGNLSELETTSAKGVLTGFQGGVARLQPLMPALNGDIAKFSSQLGDIAGHVGVGLVTLFTRMSPLFTQFGNDLVKGSAAFESWAANSHGVTSFLAYAQKELPQVEQTITALAISAAHIVEGFAPLGGGTLSTIRIFSDAINKIPVGVLQQLAPILVGLKIASTVGAAVNNLSIALGGMAVKLGLVAVAEDGAAVSTRALVASFGPLAAATVGVVTGVELLKTSFPQLNSILSVHTLPAVNENTVGIDALTNAYRDAHGGIDGTAAQLLKWGSNAANAKTVTSEYAASTGQLNGALKQLQSQVGGAGTAAGNATTYTTGLTGAQKALVGQVMSANTQLGYLSATLDKFSNNAISAEQMELQFKDALAGANALVKQNGSALDDNTTKGRANKEWLLNQITAVNQHAVAVGKQTGSVKAATSALGSDEAQLRRAADAAGLNKDQVAALIKQYALTPKQVSTNVKANTDQALGAIRGVQAALNNLQSYKVLQIVEVTSKIAAGSAGTNLAARASGGRVLKGKKYMVDELGTEMFIDDNGNAYLLPGGPHMWTAPRSGEIVNAATVRGLRTKTGTLASATLQQLPSAAKSAISAVANVLPFGSGITKALQAEDRQLEQLVAKRADIANRLKAANQQLAAAQQAYGQTFTSVQQGVIGSFDITNAGKDVFGRTSAGGIISDLSAQVSQANLFASYLRKLKGKLDPGLYRRLAEAGPVQGFATLQALAGATPGQLRQVNSLQNMLGNVGTAAGTYAADYLNGAQVKTAENLVKGLQAAAAATDRLERKMAGTIVQSLHVTIQGGDAPTIIRTLDRYLHTDVAAKLR